MMSTRNPNWYLRVKTMSEEYLVDVGSDPERARVALENARRLMRETGAVTIGDALVVNASDIESVALQDAAASQAGAARILIIARRHARVGAWPNTPAVS